MLARRAVIAQQALALQLTNQALDVAVALEATRGRAVHCRGNPRDCAVVFESGVLAAAAGMLAVSVVALSVVTKRLLGRDGFFHLLAAGSAGLAVVFLTGIRA